MKVLLDTSKTYMEYHDSLKEMVDYAQANTSPRASDKNDSGWSNTKNLQHACELAHNGWHDVRTEVDILLDSLKDTLADRLETRFVNVYGVAGGTVDIGRYVTGEPECMVSWQSEPQASMGRVVRILVNGIVSSNVDADHILRRGVAIVALLDTLHKLGVGVELYWESAHAPHESKRDRTLTTVVKIHDSSEPLDIDSVVFSMAHPSMLRRLQFSCQEQSQYASEWGVGNGYGSITNAIYNRDHEMDVVIERLQNGNGDIVQNPLAWVLTTVTGLGLVDAGVMDAGITA